MKGGGGGKGGERNKTKENKKTNKKTLGVFVFTDPLKRYVQWLHTALP